MSVTRAPFAAPFALGLVLLSASAQAQLPRMKVAIDLDPNRALLSQKETAESVQRRILSFVQPALEERGYEVVRIKDWRDGKRSGLYDVIVRLEVDARTVVLVRNARVTVTDDAPEPIPRPKLDRKEVVHLEESRSVEAWARWKAWDGHPVKEAGWAEIPPLRAGVQGHGDSATLDDEENVARLLSDEIVKSLLPAIEFSNTPVQRRMPR